MRQRVVYFVMIWVAVTSVSAQEAKKWTLDDCIDYALEKNIQLQQDKISLEESSVDGKTRQSRTISQSVVQHRTECDEPSVSGNQ